MHTETSSNVMQVGINPQVALAIAQPHWTPPFAVAPLAGIHLQDLAQHGGGGTATAASDRGSDQE